MKNYKDVVIKKGYVLIFKQCFGYYGGLLKGYKDYCLDERGGHLRDLKQQVQGLMEFKLDNLEEEYPTINFHDKFEIKRFDLVRREYFGAEK